MLCYSLVKHEDGERERKALLVRDQILADIWDVYLVSDYNTGIIGSLLRVLLNFTIFCQKAKRRRNGEKDGSAGREREKKKTWRRSGCSLPFYNTAVKPRSHIVNYWWKLHRDSTVTSYSGVSGVSSKVTEEFPSVTAGSRHASPQKKRTALQGSISSLVRKGKWKQMRYSTSITKG